MEGVSEDGFQVPAHVRAYLEGVGYALPLDPMEEWVRAWGEWLGARGTFYDYRDADGLGRAYGAHRRSLHPAAWVCAFMAQAQAALSRAFGLGTGAWAVWPDFDCGAVRVRRYDARMVIPLTWDEHDVKECAFVTRVLWRRWTAT